MDLILGNNIMNIEWDVKITDTIEYFDPELSYEITKYRPIDRYNGLDFTIEPFIEVRSIKEKTGHYCAYPPGTKAYTDF